MYYAQNHFLTLINGEVEETRNETFKNNLVSLANFVMIRFSQDKTVVPSESSWFGSFAPPDQGDDAGLPWDEEKVLPLEQQPVYREDWIGLRTVR
jgi:palmitoyl-protein thioesterase